MKDLIHQIENIGCNVSPDYPMKKYTWLRVGGQADLVAEPNNHDEFIKLINKFHQGGNRRIELKVSIKISSYFLNGLMRGPLQVRQKLGRL